LYYKPNVCRQITDEVIECVSVAVTEQCGAEIGNHFAEMGSRVEAACDDGQTNAAGGVLNPFA